MNSTKLEVLATVSKPPKCRQELLRVFSDPGEVKRLVGGLELNDHDFWLKQHLKHALR